MIERYHLVLALSALVVGAVLAAFGRWAPSRAAAHSIGLVALAAAVMGGRGNPRSTPWLVAALIVAAFPDRSDRPHPLGRWTAVLGVASLIGVWSAVPDTEPALASACVLAPTALCWVLRRHPVGPAGTAALVVTVLGSVWVGSAGWGAALAVGCAVGMVAVAPVVLGFGSPRLRGGAWWALVGAHLVVALALPRVIMRQSVGMAVLIAGVVCAALVATAVQAREAGTLGS